MDRNRFEELLAVNVNEHKEEKNGLSYLSWAWAWQEFCKRFPDATYEVYKNEQGLPYVYDQNTGYMVYVTVTADGLTHEMWLPVMDNNNNAMKSVPYTVKTKYKEVQVRQATMFDVNKAIMRCLVKCLGMFGLGLYIYAGEDLPSVDVESLTREEMEDIIIEWLDNTGRSVVDMCKHFGVSEFKELTDADLKIVMGWARK